MNSVSLHGWWNILHPLLVRLLDGGADAKGLCTTKMSLALTSNDHIVDVATFGGSKFFPTPAEKK
jgi:hypothetical protein